MLTGPECTGKTTLAEQLAQRFGAPWVPEASRAYAEARPGRNLSLTDVEPIARLHIANEGAALAGGMLFLDTDLLSTVAYSRHYYGAASSWLEQEARARLGGLYLLCTPDLPWTSDGVRDRPSNRQQMFAHFEQVLDEFGANVRIVGGIGDARLNAAERAIADALAKLSR